MYLARLIQVRLWVLITLAVISAGIGGLLVHFIPDNHAEPRAVRGTLLGVNADGTAIVFRSGDQGTNAGGRSYALGSPSWIDATGSLHQQGRPDCVRPGASGPRPIELSLVEVDPSDSRLGSVPVAVLIRCLDS
jgi:hypothetical protein